jgi:hypothetical protein
MDCFVVGTGRCGTHLLRDMLNLHPIVYIPRETHWIPTMYTAFGLTPQPWDSYTDVVDRTYHATGIRTIDNILAEFSFHRHELYSRLAEQFLDSQSVDVVTANTAIYCYLAAQKARTYCGDKTPDYGFYMSMLQQLWTCSRFIHLVRDGRDVAASMSRHRGFQRMVALNVNNWCPVSFNRYYRIGYCRSRILSASRRLATWGRPTPESSRVHPYLNLWESRISRIADEATRLRPGSYIELKYEDLVTHTSTALEQVCAFTRLPVDGRWIAASAQLVKSSTSHARHSVQNYTALSDRVRSALTKFGYS